MGIFAVRLLGLWLVVMNTLEAAGGLIGLVEYWWDGTGYDWAPAWFVMIGLNIGAGVLLLVLARPIVRLLHLSAPWPATPAVTPLAAAAIGLAGLWLLLTALSNGGSLLVAILEQKDAYIGSGFVFYTPYAGGLQYEMPWAQIAMVIGQGLSGLIIILLCHPMARWLRVDSLSPHGSANR